MTDISSVHKVLKLQFSHLITGELKKKKLKKKRRKSVEKEYIVQKTTPQGTYTSLS